MSLVTDFREGLVTVLSENGVAVNKWPGATRVSDHMLELNTRPGTTVLYVKESNKNPGFWGLTRNQLEVLRAAPIRWFAVLLLRSSIKGYLLSESQVEHRIDDGRFELSRDGDHKVNEDRDLSAEQRFSNIQEFVDRMVYQL